MTLSNTSYLCGGTFFCLLLEARKTRANARKRQNGTTDGLSDQDVLKGLIYIVTGDQISFFEFLQYHLHKSKSHHLFPNHL